MGRKGADVQGKYNYVDANGDLVSVTYTAGVDGYNEERSVTPGAVTYRAENIPAPWDGPLAGETEVEVIPAPRAPAPDQLSCPDCHLQLQQNCHRSSSSCQDCLLF